MELSKRLAAVAAMVQEKTIADIGTDHGYLPIYLVKNKSADRVIACDINKGPLTKAEENISLAGLNSKIETRLAPGLDKISPGEAECITISGMGGMLIISILENGKPTVKAAARLVLQPQKDIPRVRQYIARIGFRIDNETMLTEDDRFYTVISAVPGSEPAYTESELMFGRRLIEKKDPCLKAYIEYRMSKLSKIMTAIEKDGTETAVNRLQNLKHEHKLCEEVYKWL